MLVATKKQAMAYLNAIRGWIDRYNESCAKLRFEITEIEEKNQVLRDRIDALNYENQRLKLKRSLNL